MRRISVAAFVLVAAASAGCGEYVRDQGRAPAQPVIISFMGASGADPQKFGTTLFSDVVTDKGIFGDLGQVTMQLILKDPGQVGSPSAPTDLNSVTFNRYHVVYRRTDGRTTPGVDVPYPFDGAATFTVPASGKVDVSFELVRLDSKLEAPLLALRDSGVVIGTITDVTFYGRDQAGNDVTATGSIQVEFGNFADPK